MQRSILYLHGFASSPASAKLVTLRPIVASHGIHLNSPDLNRPSFSALDFEAMVETALAAAAAHPPVAIVGSSLGALVALEVMRRGVTKPAVLIAPALGVSGEWKTRIPDIGEIRVWHSGLERETAIHRNFFDQMATVHADHEAPPAAVTVLIGTADESVPFEGVRATWERWKSSGALHPRSRFIEIAGGDHSLLSETDLIAQQIVSAAR